jgi:hypothetical protein
MTRQQRAIACAIVIIPLTADGIALLRCGCVVSAYSIELATALLYLAFIVAAPQR